MAPLATVGNNLDQRIQLFQSFEEITEFKWLCHSSDLENILADPGHLHITPLKKSGGPARSFDLGAHHAKDSKIRFLPELLDFSRCWNKGI